jgi:hypothetical protein
MLHQYQLGNARLQLLQLLESLLGCLLHVWIKPQRNGLFQVNLGLGFLVPIGV